MTTQTTPGTSDAHGDDESASAGRQPGRQFDAKPDNQSRSLASVLEGAPSLCDVPSDRPRHAVHDGLYATVEISQTALAGVDRLDGSVLIAQVVALLLRYCGQDEVLVAVEDPLTTSCAVVRLDGSANPSWQDWVRQCQAATASAPRFASGEVEALAPASQPTRPAVHTIFVGENSTIDAAIFDLYFESGSRGTTLRYASALFDSSTIERLIGHLGELGRSARESPATPISQLALLTETERRQLITEWNTTQQPFSDGACVHNLISTQSQRSPDGEAVVCGDEVLSYRDLETRTNQLANHLLALGVKVGDRVGVYLERSPEMLIAVLATMKAGAAYVPLDPSFPQDRLNLMVEDSAIAAQITTNDLADVLRVPIGAQQVILDRDRGLIDHRSADPPNVAVSCRELVYVIYTSGSTGRPKGVMLEHRSVVNFLETMAVAPGFTAADRLLAVTTLSFDIAGLELFLPLIVGGTVVIAPRATTTDPHLLMRALERHAITVMQATPATWRLLIDGGWSGSKTLKVLCGGEALPESLAAALVDRSTEVWNMYGPTETTIWSTIQRVVPGAPVSIGRPIANTTLYVLDKEMEPTPIGVAGELLIGGDGLARGYHGLVEMTNDRFIPDAFAGPSNHQPNPRLYRTGDLVRYRPDGRIEFIGRVDHQVKVRGFRIELGEIETVLGRHREVDEVIVCVRDDPKGDKRLVAYATTVPTVHLPGARPVNSAALRRSVQDALPHYMVPSLVIFLDEMPRTPNGKTNRNAMPEPDWATVGRDTPYLAPRDDFEQRMAATWQSELNIDRVGALDDFFELGVESLASARLVARIEREFGIELPLSAVFANPTVAGLAAIARGETNTTQQWKSLVPIAIAGSKTPMFGVHGGAGTILLFSELARRLSDNGVPFYGLQAQGLYGRDPVHTSVPQMAAAYIEQIKEVQPHGPYNLVGYCFGSLVAFEIAARLQREGHEVAILASINGPSTSYIHHFDPENNRRDDEDESPLAAPAVAAHASRVPKLINGIVRIVRRYKPKALLHLAIRVGKPLPEQLRENNIFQQLSIKAQNSYKQSRFEGTMLVYRAVDLYEQEDLGFRDFVDGDVLCVEVPGYQPVARWTMKEPTVGCIADHLFAQITGARNIVEIEKSSIETRSESLR